MELPIYKIDAFTTRLFGGNPLSPRGGELFCELHGARVLMAGTNTVDGATQEAR